MITLLKKQQIIIAAFNDGKSQRQISKEIGLNRKTVRKYINQYAKAKRELLNSSSNSIDEKELIDEIVSTPKYDSSTRKKAKLTDAIIERIEFFLKENEQKRARGQGKQQKKAIDIFDALTKEGYDIGYTTVCSFSFKKNSILSIIASVSLAFFLVEESYFGVETISSINSFSSMLLLEEFNNSLLALAY
jgi:transposase-like protein